jgi:hypothetical protein
MRPNKGQVRRRVVGLVAVGLVLVLVGAYFTWCPRFGHGGATDEDQIAALALSSGGSIAPSHVWVVHNYAIAAFSPQTDNRTEMLFARRFCRWTLDTTTDVGFDREALRQRGVPSRDANTLYALLMEGYAEGP